MPTIEKYSGSLAKSDTEFKARASIRVSILYQNATQNNCDFFFLSQFWLTLLSQKGILMIGVRET